MSIPTTRPCRVAPRSLWWSDRRGPSKPDHSRQQWAGELVWGIHHELSRQGTEQHEPGEREAVSRYSHELPGRAANIPDLHAVSELAALLLELESRWKHKGSDDQTDMARGLDRSEVDRTLEAHGFRVPAELVDWYSWHNGVIGERAGSRWVFLAPTAYQQFSLQESLEERDAWTQNATRTAAEMDREYGTEFPEWSEPSFWWEPTWLPVAREPGPSVLAVDLAGTSDSVPVLVVEWSEIDDFRETRAESLTAFVRFLLDVPDVYWRWLASERRWDFDFSELPMEFRGKSFF